MTGKLATSVSHYLDGTNNRWVFLKDGAGPIPAYMVSSYFTNRIVTWVYDSATNTLYSTNPAYIPEFGDPVEQTVPILSSAIRIHGTLHDMDTFMNSFSFISPLGIVPSPRLIMYCWSAYSAKWSIPEDNPIFEFIDTNGDDIRYTIFGRRDEDRADWDRLFNVNESDGDADSDDNTIEITDEMDDEDEDMDTCDDADMDHDTDDDKSNISDDDMDTGDDGDDADMNGNDADDEAGTDSVPAMQG